MKENMSVKLLVFSWLTEPCLYPTGDGCELGGPLLAWPLSLVSSVVVESYSQSMLLARGYL